MSGEDIIVYAIKDGENIINITVDTGSVDLSDYVKKETFVASNAELTTSTVGDYVGQLYVTSTDESVYICTKIDGSTYSWKKLL